MKRIRLHDKQLRLAIFIVGFTLVGSYFLWHVLAGTPTITVNSSHLQPFGNASLVNASGATNGQALQFNAASKPPDGEFPYALEYPRPNTAGYIEVVPPTDPGPGEGLKLDPNKDYVIKMPNHPIKKLNIAGGRNVMVLGGEIRVDDVLFPGPDNQNGVGKQGRAMNIEKWTGHMYIEGVKVTGNWMFEGINANVAAKDGPNAKLTMQRMRFEGSVLAYRPKYFGGKAVHWGGDLFQSWHIPGNGIFMADWTALGLTYQGLFFQTLGNKAAPVELKRMELHHPHPDSWPPKAQTDEGLPRAALMYPGTFKYWAASGVTQFTCAECYLDYYPIFNDSGFAALNSSKPRDWANLSLSKGGAQSFVGAVKQGSPPKPFVPAGSVGIGYK